MDAGAAATTHGAARGITTVSPQASALLESFLTSENSSWPTDDGGGGIWGSFEFTPEQPSEVDNLISAILWFICSVTVIGNVLVVTVFIRDRELRHKPANLFILNLSVSDLLVGLISIPFSNIWRHTVNWIVGEVVCKLWTITDYTATTQSALAIVLISFDRLMLVSKGLKYRKYITLKLTRFLIVTSWVWSFSLNSIPILCSDHVLEPWVDYNQACDFAILNNFAYKLTVTIFSFVIPFFCLSIFNIVVYNNIRARSRGFQRGRSSGLTDGPVARNNSQGRGSSEYRKHRKAAITLALIVGAFLTCWLPWSVYKLINLIALNATPNIAVMEALAYLLWTNSAINPFLYAVTHPRIRAGLIASVLCCVPKKWRPTRVRGASQSDDHAPQTERNRTRASTGVTRCCDNECNNQGSSV